MLTTRDNPYATLADGYRNVQLAYEKMRRIAVTEKYSAVWIVESDTVPPPDALRKLLETQRATGAAIVTGLYVLRHGANVPNLFSVNDAGHNLGSGCSWQEVRRARAKGNVFRVSGGCMGCVLVTLPALDFCFEGMDLNTNGHHRAPDMDWMLHNWKRGLTTLARLDVMCGHLQGNEILRPENYL